MAVSIEEIVWGCHAVLGKYPISEDTIVRYNKCDNVQRLIEALLNSNEFKRKHFIHVNRAFLLGDRKLRVDTYASENQLARCLAKISTAWKYLGDVKPHWSVYTIDDFLPERLSGTIDSFWATGEAECKALESILTENGLVSLPGKTCVEFGCGLGRVTMPLASMFEEVHAYDISQPHLNLARQRMESLCIQNVQLHLCSGDVFEHLHKCDVFYSRLVFQHNPPPVIKYLIKNALRALRSSGIAVFQVPIYMEGYRFITDNWLAAENDNKMEMHCLPQEVIFRLIVHENCELIEIREHLFPEAPTPFISNTFVVRKK